LRTKNPKLYLYTLEQNIDTKVEQQFSLQVALLETILHTTPHFVGVVKEGLFTMVNAAGVRMFEMKDEQEMFAYAPALLLQIKTAVKQSANAVEPGFVEPNNLILEFFTRSGISFWGELKCDQFKSGGQNFDLICITNVDQLVRNREQNKLEKQKFEALFDHATVGVVVAGANGKINMINSLAGKMFGYRREELVGEMIEKLIPSEYHKHHVSHRDSFLKQPTPRPMGAGRNLYAIRSDGTNFPVEISLSSYNIGGESYVIAFIIDITVRKQNEDSIKQQRDALEQSALEIRELNRQLEKRVEERTLALRETLRQLERSRQELSIALEKERELGDLKSRFVTMASHEFRTPLSTILSSASLIERYSEESGQDNRIKHVGRIKENVKNLTDILEDFLSLGKIEEGVVMPKLEQLNIPQFLHAIIHDFDSLKKNGQVLEYRHEGEESFVIDKHLLKNIIINLVTNAIKFSNEGSTVSVSSLLKDHQFHLKVKDTGIGISTEDKEHLFDRFFRGRNAANIKGTGLGLHIVSKYLELLGGQITCESQLNSGTLFTITFNSIGHEVNIAH
jgi:PAS domain S-box-containing protein